MAHSLLHEVEDATTMAELDTLLTGTHYYDYFLQVSSDNDFATTQSIMVDEMTGEDALVQKDFDTLIAEIEALQLLVTALDVRVTALEAL